MATPATTDAVRVEPGTAGDLDHVMEVMNSAFGTRFGEAWTRSQLAGILPMAGVSLVLARDCDSGAIKGFCLSRTAASEAELLLIAVLPSHQGQGIGGVLLDHFLECGRKENVTRAHLEVRSGNPAVGMYEAAGFSAVGRRRNYYHAPNGMRYDAITLAYDF